MQSHAHSAVRSLRVCISTDCYHTLIIFNSIAMATSRSKRKPETEQDAQPAVGKDLPQCHAALLDFCAGESLSLRALRQKLEESPKGTIRAHGENATLLHSVCYNENNVTLDIVQYLLELYPGAIEHSITGSGSLPLHTAPARMCIAPVTLSCTSCRNSLKAWPYRGLRGDFPSIVTSLECVTASTRIVSE